MSGKADVDKKRKQPPSKQEYEAKLLTMLTFDGERFARRLGRAVEEECGEMHNNAAAAIREVIGRHHLKTLDSVKTINALAASHTEPLITCYYLIMNYANILLTSGEYHRRRGELTVTGQQLRQIWRIYAYRLMDMGAETDEHIASEEKLLAHNIAKLGSGGFSVVAAVKSLFGRESKK